MRTPARNLKERAKRREYMRRWRANNPEREQKYNRLKYTQYHLPRMAADPKYREHMRRKWRASKRRQKLLAENNSGMCRGRAATCDEEVK